MQRFHEQDDHDKHDHNHNLLALAATTSSQLSRAPTFWSGRPTNNSARYSSFVYSVGNSSLASQKIEYDTIHRDAPLLLYDNLPILVEVFFPCFLQVRGCFSLYINEAL